MFSRGYDKASLFDDVRTIKIAVAFIVTVIIALIGIQFWSALATFNYQPETPLPVKQARTDNAVNYKVSSITNSHLFGQLAGQASNQQNIPVTNLQLKLRGAFTSSSPQLASAIIEGPDGQTRSYKVNNRVYGQAVLKNVLSDRIVLSRNGELETLYFPEPESTPDTNVVAANNSTQAAAQAYDVPFEVQTLVRDNMSASEIQQAAKELSSPAMKPEQRQQLIRKRLQELRDRAASKRKKTRNANP